MFQTGTGRCKCFGYSFAFFSGLRSSTCIFSEEHCTGLIQLAHWLEPLPMRSVPLNIRGGYTTQLSHSPTYAIRHPPAFAFFLLASSFFYACLPDTQQPLTKDLPSDRLPEYRKNPKGKLKLKGKEIKILAMPEGGPK